MHGRAAILTARHRAARAAAGVSVIGIFAAAAVACATPRTVPAFPGAEGAGAFARGGRGGEVYRVTTLAASGPGSLAEAVSRPNRIVVFTVSGIIDLQEAGGRLLIAQPNLTIAGQSAPGEGICLRGGCLDITAGDVIVRHLRVRRGHIAEGDRGDAISALGDREEMQHVILDHVSASWATDETLTSYGRVNHITIQHCIISEGLDYENPRQTPRNHGFGSIWGSGWDDGRVTIHHSLYAHQGMRAPRVVAGGSPPAVMDFRNNVVYNCARYNGHTGKEVVYLNWIGNYYQAGPSTRPELREVMFTFFNNPKSRMYAEGNVITGSEAATRDNWLAVRFERGLSPDPAMRVAAAFDAPAVTTQDATTAREIVLADAGATLPSRDSVDLRVSQDARHGTGRVIGKETDLAPEERWPEYHSLPAPSDKDADGIPDAWELERGLNPSDSRDAMALAGSYANVEHYLNNSLRPGETKPVVHVAATVSRVRPGQPGEILFTRSGDTARPLVIRYSVGGSAELGRDCRPSGGSLTIPAGSASATLSIPALATARPGRTVSVSLQPDASYFTGCPAASLIVIQANPATAKSDPPRASGRAAPPSQST